MVGAFWYDTAFLDFFWKSQGHTKRRMGASMHAQPLFWYDKEFGTFSRDTAQIGLRLHPHVLNVLGMQMRSRLHMQISHVLHIGLISGPVIRDGISALA